MRQLPLPFEAKPSFMAAAFFSTTGTEMAEIWLDKPEQWTNGRLILWGSTGCGKSHLLHIWAATRQATTLNGSALHGFMPAPTTPIAVDDIDLVHDETVLLHQLNAAAANNQPVLMAARLPPARQPIQLPDLASRLKASSAIEVRPPNDSELATLLVRLAAERQITFELHLQNLLLAHLPRTPAALIESIARIDRAALANGRKITRNLVLETIQDLTRSDL